MTLIELRQLIAGKAIRGNQITINTIALNSDIAAQRSHWEQEEM